METQEILTYSVIVIASGFAIQSLFQTLFPSKLKVNQHGCSSGCNCDAKVMRKELLSKKMQKRQKKAYISNSNNIVKTHIQLGFKSGKLLYKFNNQVITTLSNYRITALTNSTLTNYSISTLLH